VFYLKRAAKSPFFIIRRNKLGIDVSEAILQLSQERGLSEELIQKTIEDVLLAAYRKRYGTDENAIVRFDDDNQVSILSKKKVVEHDDVYNPVDEIDLLEARELNPDADVGDEILVPIEAKEFSRQSVQLAKQTARQSIRDIQKEPLFRIQGQGRRDCNRLLPAGTKRKHLC